LFKDEDVVCGGSRGKVVKLLDKGGESVLTEEGVDEKGMLENESEEAGCCAKVIPTPIYSINNVNINSERKIKFFIEN
jgi:hypothetical protein